MANARLTDWFGKTAGAGCVAFGLLILITSVAEAILAIRAYGGWLAILYGSVGVSMGISGVLAPWAKEPNRSVLLGYFLFGIASRAVVEGAVFLWLDIPFVLAPLTALAVAMLRRPTFGRTLWAAAGAGLSILSLVALALATPIVPPLCPQPTATGTSEWGLAYPRGLPAWDLAEQRYFQRCTIGR